MNARDGEPEQDYEAGSYVGVDRPAHATASEERGSLRSEVGGYVLGLALAVLLTVASFWVRGSHVVYAPALAVALLVLAVAQMGVHLVFFLHLATDPDNANNVLALAFGVLIVCLIVFGTLWVMVHMNHAMQHA